MSDSSPAQSAYANRSDESAAAPSATALAAAHQTADVQSLIEQTRTTKEPTRSSLFSCPLDGLAKVELQLVLQFLDPKIRLIAARCSRTLLRAADDPFAWQGWPMVVHSSSQPQLGSLISQSLLRHAPIALSLDSDLPAAEVAAIPHLRDLFISYARPDALILQILALPSLQGLQTLRVYRALPLSALQLLPTLPAVHTLVVYSPDESADWSRLTAMPALTDLNFTGFGAHSLPQSALDAVAECTRLRSLRLNHPSFGDGAFARFCSTPALRQLRHLKLRRLQIQGAALAWDGEEYRAAFSALAGLESLHLDEAVQINLLLPHLAHARALRTLTIPCAAHHPDSNIVHPSHEVLRRLLTAAPMLHVRLEMSAMASLDEWRDSHWYGLDSVTVSQREQMDDQWHELQRMAAEIERVVVVDPEGDT